MSVYQGKLEEKVLIYQISKLSWIQNVLSTVYMQTEYLDECYRQSY